MPRRWLSDVVYKVLNNACFQIHHSDSQDVFRNASHQNILNTMEGIPGLKSVTMYLDTKEKVNIFQEEYLEFKINRKYDPTWVTSCGVVGIWASTYLAWKKFLETEHDFLIVFEDDVTLDKDFKERLNNYMLELPLTWEFFVLYTPYDAIRFYSPKVKDIGQENVCKIYQANHTACYLISRKGAQRAIENIEAAGITVPVDWYLSSYRHDDERSKNEKVITFEAFAIKPHKKPMVVPLEGAYVNSTILRTESLNLMLADACFEVFHTDTGNVLRDESYEGILRGASFLPRLGSPTMYLNTVDKVENFLNTRPEFKVNTVEDYCQRGETFPPSAGVVGVWASNYLAYKKFLESDYNTLVLFEDDILLSKNFKAVVETYMCELPSDWDFFSFFVPDDSLFAYNENTHTIGAKNVCVSYQQWSCAGYAVSKRGAEKAIKDVESKGISCPVDWYIFNFRMKQEESQLQFNTFTVKPDAYRPIRFLKEAAQISQIHQGSTELLS